MVLKTCGVNGLSVNFEFFPCVRGGCASRVPGHEFILIECEHLCLDTFVQINSALGMWACECIHVFPYTCVHMHTEARGQCFPSYCFETRSLTESGDHSFG